MKRHMARIRLLGADATSPRAPLFPSGTGGVLSKDQFIRASRATLRACGVETTREFEGLLLERFTGHIARISGVQWLHNVGVPMQMLQLLGRWASLTILRYLQAAPLQKLPETAAHALVHGSLLIPQQEEHQPRDDEVVTCGSDDDV